MKAITPTEYLMGRCQVEDLPLAYVQNMAILLTVVNKLLEEFGEYRKVNSGYRRPEDNRAAGGASKSAHLTCQAVDLEDKDGKLKAFLTEAKLKEYGLYMEHPDATPIWAHVQTRSTKSGNRIFRP